MTNFNIVMRELNETFATLFVIFEANMRNLNHLMSIPIVKILNE